MLWIISISGLAIGLLVFFGELAAGGFAKQSKQQAGGTKGQDHPSKQSDERGAWID